MARSAGAARPALKAVLYIVPTPLGNLRDITQRSLDVLREADVVACEDTRTSGVLLNHYGVDTPRRSELIAATHSLDEIRRYVGADTLGYLSLAGLMEAVGPRHPHYCTSCYTGQYPVAFPRDESSYLQLTLKLDASKATLPEEEPEGVV